MKDIFVRLLEQLNHHADTMLVTLVAHAGSTPRGAGSQMLVTAHGRIAGTIGGGLAEKAVLDHARAMLAAGRSGLYTCTLPGSTGSVCSSDLTVYCQHIACGSSDWAALSARVLHCLVQRRRGWFIQRLDGGPPLLLDESFMPLSGTAPDNPARLCRPYSVLEDGCFSMPLCIGERAVIFGAGHCARALAPALASVGFRVTVYDERAEYADAAHFPQAEHVVCGPFNHIEDHLPLCEGDFIVTMSHTHASDLCIQRQVLRKPHAYVGMIGGGPKIAYIHEKLLQSGVPQAMIDTVHTPIGLNIGAVTPEEIAISITAEMILIRAQLQKKKDAMT